MNKPTKMTREQALEKLGDVDNANKPINARENNYILTKKLEALGVIEFEGERKEPRKLMEINELGRRISGGPDIEGITKIFQQHGTIRLEEWPEGLVLWVGGEIVWKSWEKYYELGDAVIKAAIKQAGIIT